MKSGQSTNAVSATSHVRHVDPRMKSSVIAVEMEIVSSMGRCITSQFYKGIKLC